MEGLLSDSDQASIRVTQAKPSVGKTALSPSAWYFMTGPNHLVVTVSPRFVPLSPKKTVM